jgi:hypothetical protein
VVNGRDWRAEWDGVGAAADGQVDVSQVRAAGEGDSVPTKEVPMNGLALILFCIVPVELTVEDRVSIIEHNRYHDGDGRIVFVQYIFIDYIEGEEQIVTFRLVKENTPPLYFNHGTGLWECRFMDGEFVRRVTADSVRDSWTQEYFAGDPELEARKWFPKEFRRELRKAEVTK